VVEETLGRMSASELRSVGDVLAVDDESRRVARKVVEAQPAKATAPR
jgi:hypothetical protein